MAHTGPGVDEHARRPARLMGELAQVLSRGPRSLTPGECELVAAFVSGQTECEFCCSPHSVFAAARSAADGPPVSAKMRALLQIAAAVQAGGLGVTGDLIDAARLQNATDPEIHDTMLVAAASCMYNRYVDGLGFIAPDDQARHDASAHHGHPGEHVPSAAHNPSGRQNPSVRAHDSGAPHAAAEYSGPPGPPARPGPPADHGPATAVVFEAGYIG